MNQFASAFSSAFAVAAAAAGPATGPRRPCGGSVVRRRVGRRL